MPYDDKGIIFSKLIKAIKHYDKGGNWNMCILLILNEYCRNGKKKNRMKKNEKKFNEM